MICLEWPTDRHDIELDAMKSYSVCLTLVIISWPIEDYLPLLLPQPTI